MLKNNNKLCDTSERLKAMGIGFIKFEVTRCTTAQKYRIVCQIIKELDDICVESGRISCKRNFRALTSKLSKVAQGAGVEPASRH